MITRYLARNFTAGILTDCLSAISIATLLLLSSTVSAQTDFDDLRGDARDAWIAGQANTMLALSEHASAFVIDVDVESGNVTLTGVVDSDVNKELAGELVRGVQGVNQINNDLDVAPDLRGVSNRDNRELKRWFDQVTTTAEIKSRLLASSAIDGLGIEVETEHDRVTLNGSVASRAERSLAGEIARNSSYGRAVSNNLMVSSN
jgi:osmotically-inducible protein OsmY